MKKPAHHTNLAKPPRKRKARTGAWTGHFDAASTRVLVPGVGRKDGHRAKVDAAKQLTELLGYEVKPEWVRPEWVMP